jgi:hypothetical protein
MSDKNIYQRMLACKTEIGKIYKDATNPFAKAKYASLSNMLAKINPALDENGLLMMLSFNINKELSSQKMVYDAIADIINVDKPEECLQYIFHIPSDSTQKNDVQGFGATMTYGQRYVYSVLFNIAFDDIDPDAKEPEVKPAQTTQPAYTKPVENKVVEPAKEYSNPTPGLISEAQAKRIYAIGRNEKHLSNDEMKALLDVMFKLGSMKEMNQKQYKEYEEVIQSGETKNMIAGVPF